VPKIVEPPLPTTFSAYAANTIASTIDVEVTGTAIPLPNFQYLPNGFFISDDNTELIVVNGGVYAVQYGVYLDDDYTVGVRILLDGVEVAQSVLSPIDRSIHTLQFTTFLPQNSRLTLQLFGVDTDVALASGVGAFLSVIKLQ
jgi:hypothetical protein